MTIEAKYDLVIIGGGLGGCAAAMAAAKMGLKVVMTEETRWIGGQVTSQAVPPDEHLWIEQFGCTASYRRFRHLVRDFYARNFPLTPESARNERFNPGNAIVSRISVEPRAALAVLQLMMAPYVHSGGVTVLTEHRIESAETDHDRVTTVTVRDIQQNQNIVMQAPMFLDATECGDVLPLAGVEYVTGAESRSETGEAHALEGEAEPMDIQSITWCFALDYREGEDHTIDRPKDYTFWRDYKADFWPGPQLGWDAPKHSAYAGYSLFPQERYFSLWNYRRVIDRTNFESGTFQSDISLINWPQNDYWLGSIYEVNEEERLRNLEQARQLSLSVLYWLQTGAERPDGGAGYPGLRLRPDVVGTHDGLAMAPYIRESRRIKAEFTVLEQHLSPDERGPHGPMPYPDTVGIGCYRMDLHPSTGGRVGFYNPTYPFQIPLGALIPVRIDNLLPTCKNLGVTHVTNGCYRLHPVEWNIGESAGYLAAYCLKHHIQPREVLNTVEYLADFQRLLQTEGIELNWPMIEAV
jgi:hypothetical protein